MTMATTTLKTAGSTIILAIGGRGEVYAPYGPLTVEVLKRVGARWNADIRPPRWWIPKAKFAAMNKAHDELLAAIKQDAANAKELKESRVTCKADEAPAIGETFGTPVGLRVAESHGEPFVSNYGEHELMRYVYTRPASAEEQTAYHEAQTRLRAEQAKLREALREAEYDLGPYRPPRLNLRNIKK